MTNKQPSNIDKSDKDRIAKNDHIAKFQLKYALLFFILFLLILITFIVVIFRQNSQHIIYSNEVLKEDFIDYVKLIDRNFHNISSRLRELKISAEFSLFESSQGTIKLPYGYKFLKEVNENGKQRFNMDKMTDAEKKQTVVNITGVGSLNNREKHFNRIIHMNLNLMDDFHGFKKSVPDVNYIYMMTNNTFAHYPWIHSSAFRFGEKLFAYDTWKKAQEKINPERKLFWTDVYWEGSLMSSCVTPLYEGDKFIGIIGADIMVEFMNSVVAAFKPDHMGEMIIYDNKHNLLADSASTFPKMKKTISLQEALPSELKMSVKQITALKQNEIHDINGWQVLHGSLSQAPFKVLYISPKISAFSNIFSRIGWDVILFILAMLFLVVTFLLVTYLNFILPVERFVNFILTRSGGMQKAKIPGVPKMWRPWFSTIDSIFNENIKLYDNLHNRNIELVRKNEELSNHIEARSKAEKEKESLINQLNFSEKMRVVGQLAGGVAHDFNNQLSIILSTIKVLNKKIADNERLRSYCERILTASRRSADLVAQLLAFSRQGNYTISPVDMHSLVNEVDNLLQHTINKNISIKKELWAKRFITSGDSTQLQNALLNLAINARDAMPKGGTLSFQTENITDEDIPKAKFQNEVKPGNYLKIMVSDTGTGIKDDVLPKIFEPFFTTKEKKGHGMGLAAVYGTVQTHRGHIDVNSISGKGTTFTVYLPVLEKGKQVIEVEKNSQKAVITKKNILLVDDERDVCMSIAEELNLAGFDVVFFEESQKAVDYYKESWQNIHIVLLDIIMPELNGYETFIAMKKVNPDVKAIVFSGYSFEGDSKRLMDEGVQALFKKPLETDILIEKISELLATEPS